jgi:hypothetical protein
MPALTTQEHRQAQREAKTRRNTSARNGRAALARAWAWIEAMEAQVVVEPTPSGVVYTIRVPGFHSQSARWLPAAVNALEGNIAHFCDSRATHGPTGAKLDALRAKRAAYAERAE